MLKTNSKIKEKSIIALACFIASSVLLLSVHAKDLVYYQDIAIANKAITYKDISEKAIGELHNHIDKQVLKTFDKSSSDNAMISSRGRDDLDILPGEEDPGLWHRLYEGWLLANAYASLALKFVFI